MIATNNFIKIMLMVAAALSVAPVNAVTVVNTPHGQFSFVNGRGACTVIDLYLATQLLALAPALWKSITPEQLTEMIRYGVGDYAQIVFRYGKGPGYWFQAAEAAPYFQSLQQVQELEVAAVALDAQTLADFQDAGFRVLTHETLGLLPAIIAEIGKPVCGIWTKNNYSQLICYKGGVWLFFDSHHQSTSVEGASLYVFDSVDEFVEFLQLHPVFEIASGVQANVTLFRHNPLPIATKLPRVLYPTKADFLFGRCDFRGGVAADACVGAASSSAASYLGKPAITGKNGFITDIAQIEHMYMPRVQEFFLFASEMMGIDGYVFSQMAERWPLLRKLTISHEPLGVLPPEIGTLYNLEELDLGYDEISELPVEALADLHKLKKIILYGNPLVDKPDWPDVKARLLADHRGIVIRD